MGKFSAPLSCPPKEQHLRAGPLPRHRHHGGYATIVLEGLYLERGSSGRWTIEAGQVVSHGMFESHDNLIGSPPTTVLNVPLPAATFLPPVFTVENTDTLIAAARHGLNDFIYMLRPARIIAPLYFDWPDLLAARLRKGPVAIAAWADANGLSPATVCRGFVATFGVTPSAYRIEAQTTKALQRLLSGMETLTQVAFDCGFADQAHLCRSVKAMTGQSPSCWRRVKSVQDRQTMPI